MKNKSSEDTSPMWLPGSQEFSQTVLRDLQKPEAQAEELPVHFCHVPRLSRQVCLSQTCLLTYSDRDIIVPIILSNEGHHWPVLGWVSGIDCNELFSVVLG